MSLNIHRFAAIKGRQSGDDFYTVVCEMATIPRLFLFNEATIPTNFVHKDTSINLEYLRLQNI